MQKVVTIEPNAFSGKRTVRSLWEMSQYPDLDITSGGGEILPRPALRYLKVSQTKDVIAPIEHLAILVIGEVGHRCKGCPVVIGDGRFTPQVNAERVHLVEAIVGESRNSA